MLHQCTVYQWEDNKWSAYPWKQPKQLHRKIFSCSMVAWSWQKKTSMFGGSEVCKNPTSHTSLNLLNPRQSKYFLLMPVGPPELCYSFFVFMLKSSDHHHPSKFHRHHPENSRVFRHLPSVVRKSCSFRIRASCTLSTAGRRNAAAAWATATAEPGSSECHGFWVILEGSSLGSLEIFHKNNMFC